MKVFLDTNIFLEYFEQRREYQAVDKLLSAVGLSHKGLLQGIKDLGFESRAMLASTLPSVSDFDQRSISAEIQKGVPAVSRFGV